MSGRPDKRTSEYNDNSFATRIRPGGGRSSPLPPAYEDPYATLPEGAQFLRSLDQTLAQEVLGVMSDSRIGSRHRAKVVLLLDLSASMENPNGLIYSGKLNALVKKCLALSAFFDDDGKIEIYPFAENMQRKISIPVSEIGNLNHYIELMWNDSQRLGSNGTNYAAPLESAFRDFMSESGNNPQIPMFCILATDGDCNRQEDKFLDLVAQYSQYPFFLKSIALTAKRVEDLGQDDFATLREADDMKTHGDPEARYGERTRSRDNSDTVFKQHPRDAAFRELTFQDLIREYVPWAREVFRDRVLPRDPHLGEARASDATAEGRQSAAGSGHAARVKADRAQQQQKQDECIIL